MIKYSQFLNICLNAELFANTFALIIIIFIFSESLMFNIPYSSIYSRSRKHSVFSFPTSCVHSPMLRIPSPYFNKKAKPNPTQASSDVASNPSVGTKVASRNPRRISQTQHLKGKTKGSLS